MARVARRRARARRAGPCELPPGPPRGPCVACGRAYAPGWPDAVREHHPGVRGAALSRATRRWRTASARSSAGTRWRRSCRRTRRRRSSAGTSPATSPRRRSTRSASTTSGTHPPAEHGGDLVFFQGHSAPGMYSRAFLEGRVTESQLRRFRQEVDDLGRFDGGGISSYPHPWLMPELWQFPTVSMGLGPIMAIYQARFMKYLQGRGIVDTSGRKVWAFLGDGETDEPESLGAIGLAGRERLDNLVFVVNCNLQRLDGPVRGNGKIIQELETIFRGAGWNVVKVVWGSRWDPLLAADHEGLLVQRMEEAVDGEYQVYKARDGAFVREHFFGADPKLREMVAHMSDEEVWALNRGGHDPKKIYAAYAAASAHTGQPTVILAKTIKGYGMGEAGEGQNITHQQKKMDENALLKWRDRFGLDLTDEQVHDAAFVKPRRRRPGDGLPARAPQGARRRAARAAADLDGAGGPGPLRVRRAAHADRRARDLDDDGVRPHPQHAPARQEDRQARRPDRARRVPHVRHGGDVPAVRDLQPGRPAVPARGRRPAHVLQGGQAGPGAPGGHQRARRVLLLDRRGHVVLQPRRADDPVLHLLLDVRVPAGRGPRLGRGRQPHARLPARRHGGAHDAERRGPAARGRPLAHPQLDDPQLRLLRPHVRARGRRDRPGRPAPHAGRSGGRLLLPHAHERELLAPRADRGQRGGDPQGHVPAAAGQGAQGRCSTRPAAGLGDDPARGAGGRRPARARTSASPRTCGASRASPSCAARASTRTAGTCSIRRRRRGCPGSRRRSPGTRGR